MEKVPQTESHLNAGEPTGKYLQGEKWYVSYEKSLIIRKFKSFSNMTKEAGNVQIKRNRLQYNYIIYLKHSSDYLLL